MPEKTYKIMSEVLAEAVQIKPAVRREKISP
jgi:hypothetical protein